MSTNRIASYFHDDSAPPALSSAGPGFVTLPADTIPGVAEKWSELQSLYDLAYLLAQLDADPPPESA